MDSIRQFKKLVQTIVRLSIVLFWASANGRENSLIAGQAQDEQSSTSVSPNLSGQTVTGFVLWDVTNHSHPVPLSGYNPIPEGATLDLATLPTNLGVSVTTNPNPVGSVVFNYNSQFFHRDGGAYNDNNTLGPSFNGRGQNGSIFYPKPYSFAPLYTTLSATPWTKASGGLAGAELNLHVNIQHGAPYNTFAAASNAAFLTLANNGSSHNQFYDPHGTGYWHFALPYAAGTSGRVDWVADNLTYALYFRWLTNHDASIVTTMNQLNSTGPDYPTPCTLTGASLNCLHISDVVMWDSVAAAREYQVTGTASALTRSEDAFNYVDASNVFGQGSCPTIDYQLQWDSVDGYGGRYHLKTLETDSNYVKAAILLYEATGNSTYLTKAENKYAAIRQYFLDPVLPLYTVYVFDTAGACSQAPQRFFASANGNMIWAGSALAQATGNPQYLNDAINTAHAVVNNLSDPTGLYENAQAANDVVEPLIEGMYQLATADSQVFAKAWLLTNAGSAVGNVTQRTVPTAVFLAAWRLCRVQAMAWKRLGASP